MKGLKNMIIFFTGPGRGIINGSYKKLAHEKTHPPDGLFSEIDISLLFEVLFGNFMLNARKNAKIFCGDFLRLLWTSGFFTMKGFMK